MFQNIYSVLFVTVRVIAVGVGLPCRWWAQGAAASFKGPLQPKFKLVPFSWTPNNIYNPGWKYKIQVITYINLVNENVVIKSIIIKYLINYA